MNRNRIREVFVLLVLVLVTSCGGNKDSGEDEEKVLDPTKAVLVYPDNNEECTGGTVVSDSQTNLNLDWNKADNTTSYTVYVKNLDTGTITEANATTDEVEVSLENGKPYSWYVESKSNKTKTTAVSETWKFYLAGPGIENYAPFPAELISPENEESSVSLTVDLSWSGTDVDNDIKEYDVYLDTNVEPTTKVATTTSLALTGQVLVAGNTYYWKVITRDQNGNTSTSLVYSFSTN